MKKSSLLVLLMISFGLVACSSNNATVATYTDGSKTFTVKAGDVAKELVRYLPNNPNLAKDSEIHKRQILDRHIVPDLMYFEEKAKGLFDSKEFKKSYESEFQKQLFLAKNQAGIEIITNGMGKAKFDIARASHILIKTSKTNTADAMNRAQNILNSLKDSKNLDKDFAKAASKNSEDPGSGRNGGDLSYFTRGAMVPAFEKAVFDAPQKGLVTNLVQSRFGYHIIYVTQPKSQKTLSAIKKLVGEQKFARLSRSLQTKYFTDLKEKEVKNLFTVTNGLVLVDGQSYAVTNLPDTAKLVESFGVTYTWKDAKKVIGLFIPRFVEALNIESFKMQMRNFDNFMFLVSASDKNNVESTSKFKKKVAEIKDNLYRQLSAREVKKNIDAQVEQQVTDAAVQQQYDRNRNRYVKQEKGKQVQLTFNEAKTRVHDDLVRQLSMQAFENWKKTTAAKYKVKYVKSGLKALKSSLESELKKISKKAKANVQRGQTGRSTQPKQIKIKPTK